MGWSGAHRTLWLEVFRAGLDDLRKGAGLAWPGSRDFRMVAALAGLDPEAASRLAREAAAEFAQRQRKPGNPETEPPRRKPQKNPCR